MYCRVSNIFRLVFLILGISTCQTTGQEIKKIEFDKHFFYVTLPDNYCDISTEPHGVSILKILSEIKNNVPDPSLLPHGKLVFGDCSSPNDYPWGYIALQTYEDILDEY